MNLPTKDDMGSVTQWIYRGVWGVLTTWFRVPAEPPELPAFSGDTIQSFRPSQGFLPYLKLPFWIAVLAINTGIFIGWVVLVMAVPIVALILTPFMLVVVIVPQVASYLAIHLRYDTTWYVMGNRSLRIRRGIWIIHETTITFENVQNVTVNQGPLQRWFQIADVVVQTAGGGGAMSAGKEGAAMSGAHHVLIEGVENAPQIRDLIMSRLQLSRAGGLGDEHSPTHPVPARSWSPAHVAMLREIRDAARRLNIRP